MMLFVTTQSASMVVSSKIYELVILALGWTLHRLPMTEDVMTTFSNIWECEPISVFVPTVQVLEGVSEWSRGGATKRTATGQRYCPEGNTYFLSCVRMRASLGDYYREPEGTSILTICPC